MTRREAVTAAAAFAAGAKVMRNGVISGPGAIALVRRGSAASITVDGREVFAVDPKRFAGRPSLIVTESDLTWTVALHGAIHPGTRLPADFSMTRYEGVTGPRLHISAALGGFDADVSARAWLEGRTAACSDVVLDSEAFGAGPWSLALTGPARAHLAVDGSLLLEGSSIAALRGLGGRPLVSDRVGLRTPLPEEPSVMAHPPARRTRLDLERGGHRWTASPRLVKGDAAALHWDVDAFESVEVEAAVGRSGERCVAVARTSTDASVGSYATTLADSAVSIPLSAPRWAVSYDSGAKSSYLVADYAAHTWIPLKGMSVRVGPVQGAPAFEASGEGQRLTRVTCSPAITGAVPATSDGTIVESVLPGGQATRLAAVAGSPPPGVPQAQVVSFAAPAAAIQAPDLYVVRPDDLMVLKFEFHNLSIVTGPDGMPTLVPTSYATGSHVVVEFPPQHILEQAFYEQRKDPGSQINNSPAPALPSSSDSLPARPVKALLSGASRLAFTLPAGLSSLPFTLEALLDFNSLEPSLVPAAREFVGGYPVSKSVTISPPGPTQTAIEFPTRLHLSPNEFSAWWHSRTPVTVSSGNTSWTELWHTVSIPSEGSWREGSPSPLRAVYSPDYSTGIGPSHSNTPFRASLDASDRHQLVKIMGQYRFEPAAARLFALSALGGWLDLNAQWNPDSYGAQGMTGVSLEQWEHRATQGRDHYVKVVYAGYLFPFGHRASLIKVTERKFRRDPSQLVDNRTAYLTQRMYIVIREPERFYGEADTPLSRKLPFRSVRIETERTPDLDVIDPGIASKGQLCFWPRVGGQTFAFRLIGTDHAGKPIEFTAPLIFVDKTYARAPLFLTTQVAKAYWYATSQRTRAMFGQPIAYAPESLEKDTSLETTKLAFTAQVLSGSVVPDPQPLFAPIMHYATVRLPAVGELTGSDPTADVRFPQPYLDSGLEEPNTGQVFVELLPTSLIPVGFPGDRSGGLATPSVNISAMSRSFGAIAGSAAQFSSGTFDPGDFFDQDAKLLGGVTLGDVAEAVDIATQGPDALPKMREYAEGGDQIVAYEWTTTKLRSVSVFEPLPGAELMLSAITRKGPSGDSNGVRGHLTDFMLVLLPSQQFIGMKFSSVRFETIQGQSPKVDVNIAPDAVQFMGPLSFINVFSRFMAFGQGGGGSVASLPAAGASTASLGGSYGGTDIRIDTSGLTLTYTLAIPTITAGMFAIMDMAVSAGLHLPFDGSPVTVRFAFADREKPFLVQVMVYAGGGFCAIALSVKGMESLEASLEFGGQYALALGVASGIVYARGGIYFSLAYKSTGQEIVLEAFIRIGGAVEVLGLITISIEFYLAMQWKKVGDKGKLSGIARVTVEVEVVCFSKSVELTVQRELAGSDPGFVDQFPPSLSDPGVSDVWNDYCAAFEPAPVK